MSPEYRIEIVGRQFIVVDPSNEIVGRYASQGEAQQTIEECKKEDEGWETARLLVRNAIKAYTQIHGVAHDTARRAIRDAAEIAPERWE
jgi:hypothetical protein